MGRLFGTDGIRGVANVDLTPAIAFALGRATAHRLAGPGARIVIGRDTRRSGDMFVAALAAGASSMGAEVHLAGEIPTPGLAFLAADGGYAAGIMVSASHNPARDNGLKVLDARGMKLDDAVEDELEALLRRSDELGGVPNEAIGTVLDRSVELRARYVAHRSSLARDRASTLRVLVDCANGSGSGVAREILAATGASVESIHDRPDGVNINLRCGATDPVSLAAEVVARGVDIGFALDGDADRCVAVAADGHVVDGDQLIGLLALDMMAHGELPDGRVVASVLSNAGLESALEAAGGSLLRTPVGDKYINEGMVTSGAALGGEKSGHVIFRDLSSTGDGIITALEVLRAVGTAGMGIGELAARIPLFPQQQRAIHVSRKDLWDQDPVLVAAVEDAQQRLGRSGRILVRPSGTEPALRVMVEGRDAELVTELADSIGALVGERLH